MYIDLHCHLLPGVDDGVKDWAESLACLRIAAAEKISTICVTPHIWPEKFDNTPEGLSAVFSEWKARVEGSGLGLRVHLGSEAYYRHDLAEDWARGKHVPLGAAGRYLLVELPLLVCPQGIEKGFYELRLKGIEPVLAHPERYAWAAREPSRLAPLANAGLPFQLTTHSVAGLFGAAAQRAAFAFLEAGWAHFMASDAHSSANRAPMFREAVRVVANRYGHEVARLLSVENPRRILAGEPVVAVRCQSPKRKSFWS